MSYKKEERLKDLPYTIVGSSQIPKPRLRYTLTGKGIKEIAKRINDEDLVHIESWEDITEECGKFSYYSRISVSRKIEELKSEVEK